MILTSITEAFLWARQGIQNCADSNELYCFLWADSSIIISGVFSPGFPGKLSSTHVVAESCPQMVCRISQAGIPETQLGLQNS